MYIGREWVQIPKTNPTGSKYDYVSEIHKYQKLLVPFEKIQEILGDIDLDDYYALNSRSTCNILVDTYGDLYDRILAHTKPIHIRIHTLKHRLEREWMRYADNISPRTYDNSSVHNAVDVEINNDLEYTHCSLAEKKKQRDGARNET